MPPKLALWGGFAFVLWALWRDTRQHPDAPSTMWLPTLWMPTLWMMRCGSRTIDAWLGGGENGRWDPILLAVILVGGLTVLSRRRCRWGEVFRHNSAVFLFYGYLVLSLTWAEGLESPAIKVLRPFGDLVMALVVATEPDPRKALQTMFRRTALVLIPLSLILIRYYPALGRGQDKHWGDDPWIGVATHKNPLGQLCLVSVLAFLWTLDEIRALGRRLRHQRLAWCYLAMTIYLFNGGGFSRSSTSILCAGVAVSLHVLLGRMRDRAGTIVRRIALGVAALGAVAVLLVGFGTSLQEVASGLQGKNGDLTGRTWLWHDVIRLGLRHPFLGSGYGAFWVPSIYRELSPEVDNAPAEAHNGYLETFANLGLVGVALLAGIIFQSLHSAARTIRTDFPYGRLRLVLLLIVLLMNYSEATFPRGTHLWWFGFLAVALSAPPRAGTSRRPAVAPAVAWLERETEVGDDIPGHAEVLPRR